MISLHFVFPAKGQGYPNSGPNSVSCPTKHPIGRALVAQGNIKNDTPHPKSDRLAHSLVAVSQCNMSNLMAHDRSNLILITRSQINGR